MSGAAEHAIKVFGETDQQVAGPNGAILEKPVMTGGRRNKKNGKSNKNKKSKNNKMTRGGKNVRKNKTMRSGKNKTTRGGKNKTMHGGK